MNNPAFYYGQGGPQLGGAGRGMASGQMGGPPPHYMQQAAFRNMPPGAGGPPDPAAMQQPPPPQQHHHHRSKRQSNKVSLIYNVYKRKTDYKFSSVCLFLKKAIS